MENEYSTALDVVAHAIDHIEPDSGDYVNATEAAASTILVQPPQYEVDDEHEYSEIIRTVTITKDEDGDGVVDSQVTVTTVIRSNGDDGSNHEDSDVINKYNDAAHESYDDAIIRNADASSRKSDSDSNSDYQIVLEVTKSGSSLSKEAAEIKENEDKQATLQVEGHVSVDYAEAESLVERLVERELKRDSSVEVHAAVRVNIEEGQDDQKEGNVYEHVDYVDAESSGARHVEVREYGNREEEQERYNKEEEKEQNHQHHHQQLQQQQDEPSIYQNIDDDNEVSENIEKINVSNTEQNDRESSDRESIDSHHESEHLESTVTVTATFSAQSENQEAKSFQKTPPPSSGKFIMRSVSKADPRHVVQCITQNNEETLHRDPEQDELVYYIKGETEGSEMKQRIKSWIAPSLIQQFNKESETGSEVGQSFLPKNVGVSSARTSVISSNATREVRSVTSPTSPTGPKIPAESAVTFEASRGQGTPQGPVLSPSSPPVSTIRSPSIAVAVSLSDNPTIRNAEVAKAVEAADFKPVSHQNGVDNSIKKKEVIEQTTTSSTKGVSIYSKQTSVKVEVTNGVASTTKQNNAQPSGDWKAEVERRKQTKDFIVAQKPTQPLKLAEVPEWKLALMEKNKQRKSSSADISNEPLSAQAGEDVELEWKKEIRQILKQKSTVDVTTDKGNDIPEWQKIADSKK